MKTAAAAAASGSDDICTPEVGTGCGELFSMFGRASVNQDEFGQMMKTSGKLDDEDFQRAG